MSTIVIRSLQINVQSYLAESGILPPILYRCLQYYNIINKFII